MNLQEYISSGIVESYVLGLADPEERAAFEQMCAAHPEVRAARDQFELLLEQQAAVGAIAPPERVKQNILSQIEIESRHAGHSATPAAPQHTGAPVRSIGWSRYLAAASIALLVVSTALNFYFFRQYKNYSERYADLVASQQRIVSENVSMKQALDTYRSDLEKVQNPLMVKVELQGANVPTSPQPSGRVVVYWDSRTKEVYLGAVNLPKPATDKQYQLWAIVNGKPVDAGVFDVRNESNLQKVSTIQNVQAFAITLEKAGGSITPTMEQMYVAGNVKT